MEKTSAEKLSSLRALISQAGWDGLIVPHTDEYQSEYLPPESRRLEWLSGFSGSAGYAVVLKDKAVVASDGRYFPLQLRQQVDAGLFDIADSTKTSDIQWLADNAASGAKIGFDPRLTSPAQYEKMKEKLAEKGIGLVPTPENLVDRAWGAERPQAGRAPVEIFPASLDGRTSAEKIEELAKVYEGKGVDYAVLTLPDSIAWLLNIRGNDVECNPYVLSSAVLDLKARKVVWCVDTAKIDPADKALAAHLKDIICRPAAELEGRLAGLAASGKKAALDFKTASLWYKTALGASAMDAGDVAAGIKARKTPHQVEMLRRTQAEDGVAMVKFLRWAEENTPSGMFAELDLVARLEEFRGQSPSYRGPSFGAIVGAGGNGAIVHYHATSRSNRPIAPHDMVLVDSGGQYCGAGFAGTTDITRTIVAGNPSAEMKHDYTRVLQAHIAVAMAPMSALTPGKDVDAQARGKLKPYGLDYAHGTGHGVGQYLSVHEESPRISPREDRPLETGLYLSNEPGYYKEGAYGIRLENLVVVRAPDENGTLSFETVTYVPFEPSLVDFSLLDQSEKDWLADYHRAVFTALEKHPGLDKASKDWLIGKVAAFTREAQVRPNFNPGEVSPSP